MKTKLEISSVNSTYLLAFVTKLDGELVTQVFLSFDWLMIESEWKTKKMKNGEKKDWTDKGHQKQMKIQTKAKSREKSKKKKTLKKK